MKNGFLVQFNNVGRNKQSWEQRIERPVSDAKIVAAVKKKRVLMSNEIEAESTSDYGGRIYAGDQQVGDYFIVPGSEVR